MNERAPTYLANRVFNAATDDCLSVQIKSAAAIRLSVRLPAVKFYGLRETAKFVR